MKDAVDQTLEVGDYVAYIGGVAGRRSNPEKRQISSMSGHYLTLDFSTGRVNPLNVIKMFQQF